MPKLRQELELPLLKEMAAYLRARRESTHLSQESLAERGRSLGFEFDHSWISQWERFGPRSGFVKSLVYLKLIDADMGLLNDMIRAEPVYPEPAPETVREALELCADLTRQGRLTEALGVVISAQRQFDAVDPPTAVGLDLAGSIVSRRTELLSLARQFARTALARSVESGVDAELKAKVTIENAIIELEYGDAESAAHWLQQVDSDYVANRPALAALFVHTQANLLTELGETRTALRKFEECLGLYSDREQGSIAPRILAYIGYLRALLGEREQARSASADALQRVGKVRGTLADGFVRYLAGKTYSRLGRHADALTLLTSAEDLAQRLGRPLLQFEIHLALLELGKQRGDTAICKLMKHRLRLDRQSLVLTPRLHRAYDAASPL